MGKIVVRPEPNANAAGDPSLSATKTRKRSRRAKDIRADLETAVNTTPTATTVASDTHVAGKETPPPPPPPVHGADVEPFSIPNTLAESHIAFLRRKSDGAVHVGALLSALGSKPEDVFHTDSSWIAPEAVVEAMKSDKRMRPLHEAFSESIAVLEDLEADKENDVPFRCVDFLKAKYGHGNFDATHLIQFGGAVYKEYKRARGTEPPVRENNGFKLYFRRDIPVMQKAFDDWSLRLSA